LYDDRNVINIDTTNTLNFKEKNDNAYLIVYTKQKDTK